MSAAKMRVLLVDDCEADRHMLSRAWDMAGVQAQLHCANDGVQALHALESTVSGAEEPYQL